MGLDVGDLRGLLDAGVAAVRTACGLTERVRAGLGGAAAQQKADRSPVTVADFAGQAVICSRLARAFPGIPFVAEEDPAALVADAGLRGRVLDAVAAAGVDLSEDEVLGAIGLGGHPGGRGRFWVLDPVDGTKGFLRDAPYAVCLALVDDGVPLLAVVGCPNLPAHGVGSDAGVFAGPAGSLFFATRGGGAFEQGLDGGDAARRIGVSAVRSPAEAVFLESFEAAHVDHGEQGRINAALGSTTAPVRLDGQTKFAALARGDASVYLRVSRSRTYHQKIWDVVAGALLVEEAGGRVTDLAGQPIRFDLGRHVGVGDYLATNGALHDAVLAALADARD